MSRRAPLATLSPEMSAALECAKTRGGKLVKNADTLYLFGPADYDQGRDTLDLLWGLGTVRALVSRGLMCWPEDTYPSAADHVTLAEGAQSCPTI